MRRVIQIVVTLAFAATPWAAMAADAPAKAGAKPVSKEVERGKYLVTITGCHGCHTPDFLVNGGRSPEKDYLTGGVTGWRGSWGTTYPVNLRLYFQGVTEEQWVQVAKEVQRRPPMPYHSLNAMSQADVRAIYKYIRHLGPAGAPAPAFVPADREPPKPYVQFPV
jgi:mono/diheme cytochrome c family protein